MSSVSSSRPNSNFVSAYQGKASAQHFPKCDLKGRHGRWTYNDDTALLGIRSPGVVASESQLFETTGILVADDASSLVGRDVDVLVSELCLGRGRVDGFREALTALQPGRLRQAVDGLGLLVPVLVSGCRDAL